MAAQETGVVRINASGAIRGINGFLAGMLLMPVNVLLCTSLGALSRSLPAPLVASALTQLAMTGHLRHTELPLYASDGLRLHFDYHCLGQLPDGDLLLECRFRDLVAGEVRRGKPFLPVRRHRLQMLDTDRLLHVVRNEWHKACAHGTPLSLLNISVRAGHQNSNGHPDAFALALRTLTLACAGVMRSGDSIGRIGGLSFLMLLPETGNAIAHKVVERLNSVLEECPWGTADSAIPASIAVATSSGRQLPELPHRSDMPDMSGVPLLLVHAQAQAQTQAQTRVAAVRV